MFLYYSFYFSCSLIPQRERKKRNALQQMCLMKLWSFESSIAFLYGTDPFFTLSVVRAVRASVTASITVFLNAVTFIFCYFLWSIVCLAFLPCQKCLKYILRTFLTFFPQLCFISAANPSQGLEQYCIKFRKSNQCGRGY